MTHRNTNDIAYVAASNESAGFSVRARTTTMMGELGELATIAITGGREHRLQVEQLQSERSILPITKAPWIITPHPLR